MSCLAPRASGPFVHSIHRHLPARVAPWRFPKQSLSELKEESLVHLKEEEVTAEETEGEKEGEGEAAAMEEVRGRVAGEAAAEGAGQQKQKAMAAGQGSRQLLVSLLQWYTRTSAASPVFMSICLKMCKTPTEFEVCVFTLRCAESLKRGSVCQHAK